MFHPNRLVLKVATLLSAAGMAALVTACVPQTPETTTPTGPVQQQEPVTPPSEDIQLGDLGEVKLTSARFVPEGFTQPGMVRVVPKKKPTLAAQRKKQAKAKPEKKAQETQILATLMWEEATMQPEEQAKALREETRTLLRTEHDAMGQAYDDILLQMLFAVELALGDEDAAIKAGDELLARFPTSAGAKALAPWVAYYHLTHWQTAEAAQIAAGFTPEQIATDYQQAYIAAWVAYRQGNYAAAVPAIVAAAKNWKNRMTQTSVERDFLLMMSRAGTPVAEAAATFAELSGGAADVQFVWLYRLYEGYEQAGYNVQAAEALEKALEVYADKVPPDNRVVIRQRQSNNYLVAHQPDKAADMLLAAYQALGPCGDKCKGKDVEIAEQAKRLAPHFHTTYTTTQDERFYGPAKKLYEFYISLKPADAATVQSYLTQLEETKERATAASGKHDKTTIEWSLNVRNQAVGACYEKVLQGEPELTGAVKLSLAIADTGAVAGATTEPAAGEQGLAAVGTCLQERAKEWTFPSRSLKGQTTVSRTYLFEPAAGK